MWPPLCQRKWESLGKGPGDRITVKSCLIRLALGEKFCVGIRQGVRLHSAKNIENTHRCWTRQVLLPYISIEQQSPLSKKIIIPRRNKLRRA